MSYKPDERDWMAYLYGEMEEEEKRRIESYLLANPEAASELDRLKNLRSLLSNIEDKEVIAPPLMLGENGSNGKGRVVSLWHSRFVRAVASIAASLILVILVGKLTGMMITASEGVLSVSFGAPAPVTETPSAPALSEAEVMALIEASLKEHNLDVEASLDQTRRKLDTSIKTNLAANSQKIDQLIRESATASESQIRQVVDGMRSENMQLVKDYFQLTSTEQKKYIENLLVDFSKYMQQQRIDDLQLMQTRMNNIEQNTNIFKQETEEILSSIITTVGTTPERRN